MSGAQYDRKVRRAMAIANEVRQDLQKIRKRFAGESPEVQGAALADLVGTWLAGHDPVIRQKAFEDWSAVVVRLVDVNEKEVFGEAGHPGWRADKAPS